MSTSSPVSTDVQVRKTAGACCRPATGRRGQTLMAFSAHVAGHPAAPWLRGFRRSKLALAVRGAVCLRKISLGFSPQELDPRSPKTERVSKHAGCCPGVERRELRQGTDTAGRVAPRTGPFPEDTACIVQRTVAMNCLDYNETRH